MWITESSFGNDVSDINAPNLPASRTSVGRDLHSSENPAIDASIVTSPVAWNSPTDVAIAEEQVEEQGWGGWGGE